jgi:hypothetical protein
LSQFLLIILIQTSLGLIYSWISFLTIQALHLGQSFNRFLAIHDDAEVSLKQMVEELMTDTAKADRSAVPDTGVDSNWEYQLSSIFIDTEKGQVNMHDSTRFMLFSAKKKSFLMVDVVCLGKCHAYPGTDSVVCFPNLAIVPCNGMM